MKKILSLSLCLLSYVVWGQEEMPGQQRMMEMATPDTHHQLLAKMAGNHTAKSKFRMVPDAPWGENTYTSTAEMIMGGRFLFVKASGDFMGTPFKGQGVMGFDKEKKKFVSTWIDNFGTMLLVAEGEADMEKQQITTMADMTDPASGQPLKMKMVYTIKSDTEYTLEMSYLLENGDWFNNMNLTYTKTE